MRRPRPELLLAFALALFPGAARGEQKTGTDLIHALFGNPLVVAADKGDVAALTKRLDKGASTETKDEKGRTLLTVAVSKGRLRAAHLLIERKANVNAVDSYYRTPLMYAADRGYDDLVTALLDAGADVNARTPDDLSLALRRFTPLMFAARNGQTMVVETLLKRGADIDAIDNNNYTALKHAEESGNLEVVRLIEKIKADRSILAGGPGAQGGTLDAAKIERVVAQAVMKAQEQKAPAAPAKITSDVDSPRYKEAEDPKKFALVVGISKYSDLPEASFAERDALSVAVHLEAMGYPRRNIVSLVGEKATKTGLLKTLETWLPRNVVEGSTVFFYFSGHGAPDAQTGEAFLVPWDGDPLFLQDTAYPLKRLYEKLDSLKAKRVIVALDSCFSGAGGRSVLAKGIRPLVQKVDMGKSLPPKIVALSASQADQISGTVEDQGHGAFTYFLLKGLNGEAADSKGAVTIDALFNYLTPKVQDAARRQNRDQLPQLMKGSASAADVLR